METVREGPAWCGAFSFPRSKQIASGGFAGVASERVIRLHESVPRTSRDLNGATFREPWQVEGGNRRNGYTWKVGVTYPDGKRSVLSRKAATSEEALEAIRGAVNGRKPRDRRSTTMSELAGLWEAAQRNPKTAVVSEQTRLQYVSTWKRHLDPHFGARALDSITHEDWPTSHIDNRPSWVRSPRMPSPLPGRLPTLPGHTPQGALPVCSPRRVARCGKDPRAEAEVFGCESCLGESKMCGEEVGVVSFSSDACPSSNVLFALAR